MSDLIEALMIFRKYADPHFPTYCMHDELRIMEVAPSEVGQADIDSLAELGFFICNDYGEQYFGSFRYGSA